MLIKKSFRNIKKYISKLQPGCQFSIPGCENVFEIQSFYGMNNIFNGVTIEARIIGYEITHIFQLSNTANLSNWKFYN